MTFASWPQWCPRASLLLVIFWSFIANFWNSQEASLECQNLMNCLLLLKMVRFRECSELFLRISFFLSPFDLTLCLSFCPILCGIQFLE
jgi:hypothetical protein